jgi:hypothetical protein
MIWVGFVVLLLIGAYFLACGVTISLAELGFAGKVSLVGFFLSAVGVALVYLAWFNKPFTIVVS